MKNIKLSGVLPVVSTPFHNDGSVDETSFHKLMEYLVQSGVSGLMMFGIASEFYKLSESERDTLRKIFLQYTSSSSVLGIVSITDHSYELARQSVQKAQEDGADAINIFPPYFMRPSKPAIIKHIEKIAEVAKVPIIVQYAPKESGVDLDPLFFATLQRDYPQVIGVKVEAQPPGVYITALRKITESIQTLVGYAGVNMSDAFLRGADGVQPGSSFVEVYNKLWEYYAANQASFRDLYERLLPYLSIWMQSPEYLIKVEKEILRQRGIIKNSYCRAVSYELDKIDYDRIHQFLGEFSKEINI